MKKLLLIAVAIAGVMSIQATQVRTQSDPAAKLDNAVNIAVNDCISVTSSPTSCLQQAQQTVKNHAAHHSFDIRDVRVPQMCISVESAGSCKAWGRPAKNPNQ